MCEDIWQRFWFVWWSALLYRFRVSFITYHLSLHWHHNGRDSVSNHQPHDCLLNRLFRRRSKETSKRGVTDLCAGNSPGTGEFPAQMASNAENVPIWWRHHDSTFYYGMCVYGLFSSFHYIHGSLKIRHQWVPWVHYSDVIMGSIASRLFTQAFIQAQIKEKKKKAPRHWPLCENSPHTKGHWRGKCFYFMTSSCNLWQLMARPVHRLKQSLPRYGRVISGNWDIGKRMKPI